VVLPCGHTYVCNICAVRLERCMECRETLFAAPVQCQSAVIGQPPPRVSSFSAAARSGRRAQTLERPRSMTLNSRSKSSDKKKRLPLPKNLVLLSLMEASEMSKNNIYPSMFEYGQDDRRETADDEEQRIRMSTKITAGVCGTYAVGTQELTILPNMPEQEESRNDDIDYSEKVGDIGYKPCLDEKPMILSYGDRVQVVRIINGWAKLARGYGYVHLKNSKDLIKVGRALDKACMIEAMIHALSQNRDRTKRAKVSIERDAYLLMKELQTTLLVEEDLTVIDAVAFNSNNIDDSYNESSKEKTELRDCDTDGKDVTPPLSPTQSMKKPLSTTTTPYGDEFSSFISYANRMWNDMTSSTTISPPRENERSPRLNPAMVHGARSWRERNGRRATQGIDFRTGMSGHNGANSHTAQKHDLNVRSIPRMSCHSGLTVRKRNASFSQD